MSAFDPFDPALFSMTAGCLPCCAPPGECACAMLIPITESGSTPIFGGEYANYSDASDVVNQINAKEWASCYAYFLDELVLGGPTSLSDDATVANELEIVATASEPGIVYLWASITVGSGATIDIPFLAAITGGFGTPLVSVNFYNCTTGVSDYSATGSGASGTISVGSVASGTYNVRFSLGGVLAGPGATASLTVTITATAGSLVPNPVIALYDDSGTTRQLEACPRLLLPPLTESTGTWYADAAAAAAVLASAKISSGCLGYYYGVDAAPSVFTVTYGGSSVSVACTSASDPTSLISVNVEAGETISAAFTRATTGGTGTLYAAVMFVYDDMGTLIDNKVAFSALASDSGTLTSIAMPYTGRYTVLLTSGRQLGTSPSSEANTFSVTSSGTISANPIQALWDSLLDCPGRTDC